MALSERLAYILDFNVSGAVKGLEKVGSTADKELGKAEKKLDKLGGNLTKFGAGAVAFAGVAGVALLKTGQAASDLGESVNAVNVTFGDAADGILKLGKNAARSVGMSATEFNGLAVQFSSFATTVAGKGGDVVGTMDDMTTRAADFASVMNIEVADAARMFQSGLAGETEPLKKFGLDLSAAAVEAYALANGIINAGEKMTESEKVTARYGALMEQTAKTQGDFANTSDSFANQQRILKAEFANLSAAIGEGVIPMMTAFSGVALKVVGGLTKLNEATGGAVGKFATLGVAGIGLLGTLSLVAGQVIKMRDRFSTLGDDGTRSLNNMGKAAKGLGIAMGVAGVALLAFSLHQKAVANRNREMVDSFAAVARASDKALGRAFQEAMARGLLAGNELADVMAEFAESSIESARRVLDNAEAIGLSADETQKLAIAVTNETEARKVQAETTERYSDAAIEATEATEEQTEATEDSTEATRDLGDESRNAKMKIGDLSKVTDAKQKADEEAAKAARDHAEAIEDLKLKTIELIGGDIALRESQRQTNDALTEYAEAAKEAKVGTVEYQVAQDAAASSVLAGAEAAVQYAADQAELNGTLFTAKDRANTMVEALTGVANSLRPDDPLRAQLRAYIAELLQIPSSVTTQLRTTGQKVTAGGDFIGQLGGRRAHGGPVTGGTPYLVGEQGPEIVVPSSSGTVIANNKIGTAGGMGAAPINLTVNVGLGAGDGNQIGRQVVNAIKQYERSNGTGWRT